MKRRIVFILTVFAHLLAFAQQTQVSGVVKNAQSGERIAQVSVSAAGGSEAVVTNEDGVFSLKSDRRVDEIVVSHVGYRTQRVKVDVSSKKTLNILLQPASVQLHEVVVWTNNPKELMNAAISRIPQNYSKRPELLNCFYRETAMKRQHYITVAEGVVDMYKTAYNGYNGKDRVAIRKGRRLLSPKQNDTLGVKVIGGPVQPIQLDVVKNLDFLLNDEELSMYDFSLLPPEMIDDREQLVVAIKPHSTAYDYALYFGRFYIDRETLAFTRVELELDMRNREKATRCMLVRKPFGVRFRPKELSCVINYKRSGDAYRLSYIRNTFRFNCDWRRRLFATGFTAVCELVITDQAAEATPIKGRQSFDSRDAFFDKVDYFRDPDFWSNYNIIEPSESLDHAINKILKRYPTTGK
jgi:hypothetical protein